MDGQNHARHFMVALCNWTCVPQEASDQYSSLIKQETGASKVVSLSGEVMERRVECVEKHYMHCFRFRAYKICTSGLSFMKNGPVRAVCCKTNEMTG